MREVLVLWVIIYSPEREATDDRTTHVLFVPLSLVRATSFVGLTYISEGFGIYIRRRQRLGVLYNVCQVKRLCRV